MSARRHMMKTCNIGPRVKKNVTSWCANLSDHLINLSVAKKRQVQVVFLGKGWGLVWSGLGARWCPVTRPWQLWLAHSSVALFQHRLTGCARTGCTQDGSFSGLAAVGGRAAAAAVWGDKCSSRAVNAKATDRPGLNTAHTREAPPPPPPPPTTTKS